MVQRSSDLCSGLMIPSIQVAVLAFRLVDVVRKSRDLLVVLGCVALLALRPDAAFAGQQPQLSTMLKAYLSDSL